MLVPVSIPAELMKIKHGYKEVSGMSDFDLMKKNIDLSKLTYRMFPHHMTMAGYALTV